MRQVLMQMSLLLLSMSLGKLFFIVYYPARAENIDLQMPLNPLLAWLVSQAGCTFVAGYCMAHNTTAAAEPIFQTPFLFSNIAIEYYKEIDFVVMNTTTFSPLQCLNG